MFLTPETEPLWEAEKNLALVNDPEEAAFGYRNLGYSIPGPYRFT
jgi:hypothetical protein